MGGARGGGKTDGVLGKWLIKERRYGRHFNAIMLRKTTVSAEDAIERSRELYGPMGGRFNEAKLRWRMPNGGRVSFGYLENIGDANAYQGRNVTDVWIEEAGQYDSPAAIDRMFGVLRSAHGVPIQMILTANPGGAGQHFLRERYQLSPLPRRPKIVTRMLANGTMHSAAVIPARITDNKILLAGDPGYVDRLHLVGSEQLVKGWLDGDWTAVEGAFFECWSEKLHVLRPVALPQDWIRLRAADWGSASPFAVIWMAVCQDQWQHPDGQIVPRGALVCYREWYGSKDPGASGVAGLKMTGTEVGAGIAKRERDDPKLAQGVLDPSAFAVDGGPSVAESINNVLLKADLAPFRRADNKRVPTAAGNDRRGPMSGWDQMRARLIGTGGRPMLFFFETCVASIRTIPVLQHDAMRAEDLDTNSEDHAVDAVRYGCMARPWLRSPRPPETPDNAYKSYADDRQERMDVGGRSVKLL